MKNSKEYSEKLKKLYRSLKRGYPKVQKLRYDEPLDALVYGIISENMSEAATRSAMKRLAENFVDLNDLRVSQNDEIMEMLGDDSPVAADTALTLCKVLKAVFDKYNTVSLGPLKKMGKRPARQVLESLEGPSRFTVDYCMLTCLQSHAIPLTKRMLDYLKGNELVYPDSDAEEVGGFLIRLIAAKDGFEFYALLRQESESGRLAKKAVTRKKSTVRPKKKTVKKTKKKATKTTKKTKTKSRK
jgi:endonuclease III